MERMMQNEEMEETEYNEGTGLDEIISRVEKYIKNPKMVTPETLEELRADLVGLKEVFDGEEGMEESEEMEEPKDDKEGPSLAIIIGKKMRRR